MLVKRYPGFFMFQGSTASFAKGAIGVLKKLKDTGQIGNKVAAVNVGDDFGIELANAGRPLFKEAGFEIVYDKSYPLGTQTHGPLNYHVVTSAHRLRHFTLHVDKGRGLICPAVPTHSMGVSEHK
jgi:hypothetical protein